uniref:Rx N-terminal domain-containing protein n=1 Tax=Oryza meridionalis TaxID=40149 RepID=A0A0E0EFR2_9ORYZ
MGLVTGAMGNLLPKMVRLLKEEYNLQIGVRKKIESLLRELDSVYTVLRVVGEVPPEQLDMLVKLWALDLREASYEMEDIIDTFLVHHVDKIGKLFKKVKVRRKIAGAIQDIDKKLKEVAARRGRYTVDDIVVAKPEYQATIDPRLLNLFKKATELHPDMKKVVRDILIDLDKQRYMQSIMMLLDERQLINELQEFLQKKRVVATTRIFEVAAYVSDVYKMKPLSHEDSKKLLYTRIVGGEDKCLDSDPLADACEKILKKCCGVPLAIIIMASLLANKPMEDWPVVYKSIGLGHGGNNDDYYIEKNILIWKWITEGFVHEEKAAGIGLFELGEGYFNELINRSLILPAEDEDKGYRDGCHVHDMVLDLVLLLSAEENFVTVLDGSEQLVLPSRNSRRLALQCRSSEPNIESPMLPNIGMEQLRSFVVTECCDINVASISSHVIRVLALENCLILDHCGKHALQHVWSLLHLRYLGLQYIDSIELPEEVGHLKFLQVLDLSGM